MNAGSRALILEWLARHRGDLEATARYMRDVVKLGSIRACRALIWEAYS